jgi:hypothetical protein
MLGIPSSMFMPKHVLLRLVERAHVCSDIARLEIICTGWKHVDTHGIILLEYLGKILTGFSKIFREGEGEEEAENTDEQEAQNKAKEPSNSAEQAAPVPARQAVRLVLQPKQSTPFQPAQSTRSGPITKCVVSPPDTLATARRSKRLRDGSNKENA